MFLQKVESKNAPAPVGAYSPAVKLGDFMYMSGQLGIDPTTNKLVDGLEKQTTQAMENIKALLAEKGLMMHHIVKTTILLDDISSFGAVNEIYATYFDGVYPARSAFEVSKLPLGGLVEIECLVIDTLVYEKQQEGCGDGGCCGGHDENCEHGGCEDCK